MFILHKGIKITFSHRCVPFLINRLKKNMEGQIMVTKHLYLVHRKLYASGKLLNEVIEHTSTIMEAYKLALDMIIDDCIDPSCMTFELSIRELFLTDEEVKNFDDYLDCAAWVLTEPFYERSSTIIKF